MRERCKKGGGAFFWGGFFVVFGMTSVIFGIGISFLYFFIIFFWGGGFTVAALESKAGRQQNKEPNGRKMRRGADLAWVVFIIC